MVCLRIAKRVAGPTSSIWDCLCGVWTQSLCRKTAALSRFGLEKEVWRAQKICVGHKSGRIERCARYLEKGSTVATEIGMRPSSVGSAKHVPGMVRRGQWVPCESSLLVDSRNGDILRASRLLHQSAQISTAQTCISDLMACAQSLGTSPAASAVHVQSPRYYGGPTVPANRGLS